MERQEKLKLASGNDPDVLCVLSQTDDAEIRTIIAGNRITPSHILSMLSHDAHDEIRRRVSANPNVSLDTIRLLLDDVDPTVLLFSVRSGLSKRKTRNPLGRFEDWLTCNIIGKIVDHSDCDVMIHLDEKTKGILDLIVHDVKRKLRKCR